MDQTTVRIPVQRTPGAADLPLPRYMTGGASGMDLYAALEKEKVLAPGERAVIPTGLMAAVPEGFELQIRPRSGLAANHGIGVINAPGTVDSDYRGEIKVILINLGRSPFKIGRGDRIAQMVLSPLPRMILEEFAMLPATERGRGGFGHTG